MKTKYPIEILDLRNQPDHISPQKIQLIQEYGADPDNAKLFLIIVRRREVDLISDGNKLIEVKVIKMKILNFTVFRKKYNLKDDTMNESKLEKVYNYELYRRYSKIFSDTGFVNM